LFLGVNGLIVYVRCTFNRISSLKELDKKLFFEIRLPSKKNYTSAFNFVLLLSKYFSGENAGEVSKVPG